MHRPPPSWLGRAWLLPAAALVACKDAVKPAGPIDDAAGAPALHRMTEVQLNRTLDDLFEQSVDDLSLPPEIAVHGFSNNALTRDASPYLVEVLQRDLTELTAELARDGGTWLACDPGGGGDPAGCGHTTLARLQQRAWRRGTTPVEQAWLMDLFDGWQAEVGFEQALQLSLLVVLQSPDFLYLVEHGEAAVAADGARSLTSFEVATRLSYFLWDTMPDAELFELAARDALQDPAVVRQQAQRMLLDERSRQATNELARQWLGYDKIQEIDPDPDTFFEDEDDDDSIGGSVAELKAAYMAEFDLFVRHALFEAGTLDALLTSRVGFVSRETAPLYGVSLSALSDAPSWTMVFPTGQTGEYNEATVYRVDLDSDRRAGIFTQGAFLAGHAHAVQPSPVLRGVFLRERMLCVDSVPPPDDVPPLDTEDNTGWTTNRERYAAHTNNPACATCHESIDGIGFTFENYDALGAWRDTDNGAPVDATGKLFGTDVDGNVTDAIELVETLAASRQVYDCAVKNVWRYGMHRSETGDDLAALHALQDRFWASGGTWPQLLVDFASSRAFLTTKAGG